MDCYCSNILAQGFPTLPLYRVANTTIKLLSAGTRFPSLYDLLLTDTYIFLHTIKGSLNYSFKLLLFFHVFEYFTKTKKMLKVIKTKVLRLTI